MGLTDSDLRRLQEELLANPAIGAVMKGTGGVRKMRLPFEHRGKSGSVRVIYIDFEIREKLYAYNVSIRWTILFVQFNFCLKISRYPQLRGYRLIAILSKITFHLA